jgi:hypothetical protein
MTLSTSPARRGLIIGALLLAAALPASGQDTIEGHTLDGATFSLPRNWVLGQPLPLAGTNWTTHAGDRGSVIGVKYDFGEVVPADPVDEVDDLWMRIVVPNSGEFAVELPFPADAGWEAGETHTVHLLTGMLGDNDKVRNPTLRVTVVAE